MANLNCQEVRTIFTRFKNDTLPRVSDDLFIDFLNDLQLDIREYLKNINPEEFISTQNITPSSDLQITALNADFWNILWHNSWLYKLDSNWIISWDSVTENKVWSIYSWYYISWNNVIIKWYQNASLQLRYYTKMTDLLIISDSTIFPNDRRYYPLFRNMLNMLYNGWLNDDYQEQRSSVKYEQDMKNLSMYLRKQHPNINFEQSYI